MYQLVEKNGYRETLIAEGSKGHCQDVKSAYKGFADLTNGKLIIREVK